MLCQGYWYFRTYVKDPVDVKVVVGNRWLKHIHGSRLTERAMQVVGIM